MNQEPAAITAARKKIADYEQQKTSGTPAQQAVARRVATLTASSLLPCPFCGSALVLMIQGSSKKSRRIDVCHTEFPYTTCPAAHIYGWDDKFDETTVTDEQFRSLTESVRARWNQRPASST